ncbi:MAG: head-tail adaptor protein [Fimbriimonadia bacterium]|nr:head-tail adaptor protein [Fimbriimonadia bacterium]
MLTNAELTSMRQVIQSICLETVQVRRKSLVSDGAGGYAETWSTIASLSGRVCNRSRRGEPVAGDSVRDVSEREIVMPHSADVRPEDRLLVGGVEYEVKGVNTGRSDSLCLFADCVGVR